MGICRELRGVIPAFYSKTIYAVMYPHPSHPVNPAFWQSTPIPTNPTPLAILIAISYHAAYGSRKSH